jgi:hypothetical protein
MPAPVFKDLVTFPASITLLPSGGGFESDSFTSGALVRSIDDGRVVMRFEAGPDWTFVATGTQQQETTQSFSAGQEAPIPMPWRVRTTKDNALNVAIRVRVSMEGEDTSQVKDAVMTVVYAGALLKFMRRVRRMFSQENR